MTVFPTDDSKPELLLDTSEIKMLKLGLRIMKIRSPKYIFGYGATAISFYDLKYGVKIARFLLLKSDSQTFLLVSNLKEIE